MTRIISPFSIALVISVGSAVALSSCREGDVDLHPSTPMSEREPIQVFEDTECKVLRVGLGVCLVCRRGTESVAVTCR